MERRTIEYMDEEFTGYTIDEYGGIINRHGRVLRPHVGREGYSTVTLPSRTRGRSVSILVHRLVCWTFHGPPPSQDDFLVRHLDGVRSNNHRDNLRWGTPQDNADDRRFHRSIGQHHVHVDVQFVPKIGVATDPLAMPKIRGVKHHAEELRFIRDLCLGLIRRGVPARLDVCGYRIGVWFIIGMEIVGCHVFEKCKDRSKRHVFLRVDAGCCVDVPASVTSWADLHRFAWDDDMDDPCVNFRHFELTALGKEIATMGDWIASMICARSGIGSLDPSRHKWTHEGLSGRYTWTTTAHNELLRCTPKEDRKSLVNVRVHDSVIHRKTSKSYQFNGSWVSYMYRNEWKTTRILENMHGDRPESDWYQVEPAEPVVPAPRRRETALSLPNPAT